MSPNVAADREVGRHAVVELCESFERDLDYHKSREFDETTARQRFIDPFFAALGWDVADEARRGPYADVVLESSLPHGGAARFALEEEEAEDARIEEAVGAGGEAGPVTVRHPDYSFSIDGARQFFVEAKRPSVNISSPRPIFQVKSYAWSSGTPLALLTDFEDLLVFDCRHRPVLEESNTGLLPEFSLNFRQYPDAWDRLWDIFSREAVAAGSLTRYREKSQERGGQLPVDRAFLSDLGRWRAQLAKAFARDDRQLDVWQLNDATQLTLDRVVLPADAPAGRPRLRAIRSGYRASDRGWIEAVKPASGSRDDLQAEPRLIETGNLKAVRDRDIPAARRAEHAYFV